MTGDINNFYLNTPLTGYKYILLRLEYISGKIGTEYKSQQKATPEGYVYLETQTGTYWLPQEGFCRNNYWIQG